jgi:hypothetical protein
MRWLVLLFFPLLLGASTSCNIGEFKILALTEHDSSKRKEITLDWLKKNAKQCSNEQLVQLYNHFAEWLGSSDNFEIRGLIYEHYRTEK